MKIAVAGIGKLGIELARVFSSKHDVIGIDPDQQRVAEARQYFPASTDLADIKDADLAFIVVNTTHSIDDLRRLIANWPLEEQITDNALIVITSTVPPGTTTALSRLLGHLIIYNPVFIAQGRIMADLLNPSFILIGCLNKETGEKVKHLWESVLEITSEQYVLTNPMTAEIAKLALNACLCTKIHLGNVLSDLCKEYAADNETVLRTLELDNRINTAYMKPGMGFGGPCLPIDLLAFNKFAEDPVLNTLYMTNALRPKKLAQELVADGTKTVAVLGLTYKCNVPIIEESPGLALVHELELLGVAVYTHDPQQLNYPYPQCNTAAHAIEKAEAVVIALPYPGYAELDYTGKGVIDPWGLLK